MLVWTSASGATLVATMVLLHGLHRRRIHDKRLRRTSLLRTYGVLLWPCVLMAILSPSDRTRPVVAVPLLYVLGVWALDAHLLSNAPTAKEGQLPALRLDPTSLGGLTFGVCSLSGVRPESKYSHLFLYAVVGTLVAVLPSHNLREGCVEADVIESLQKVALLWCTGLLVAGVALTLQDRTQDTKA